MKCLWASWGSLASHWQVWGGVREASKQKPESGRNSWLMATAFCSADVRCNQVTSIKGRLPRLTPTLLCGLPWGQEKGTDSTLQSHLSFSSCMSLPPTLKAKMSFLVLTYLSFSLVRSGESWGPKRPGRRRAGEKSRRGQPGDKTQTTGEKETQVTRQRTDNRGRQMGEQSGCIQLESAPMPFIPACQAAEAGTLLQGIPAARQQSGEPMPPSHGEREITLGRC